MDLARLHYLRHEVKKERVSWGEVAEIQGEFEKIDPATLPEPAENAGLSDMLNEIETRMVAQAQGLITAVDDALDASLKWDAPALLVTKKGNIKCPWCRRLVGPDTVIILDCEIRWNRCEPRPDDDGGGGTFRVGEGDGQFDTFGYMTECCMALVSFPEGWEDSW